MNPSSKIRRIARCLLLGIGASLAGASANSQTPPPAWDQTTYFKYNIENILVSTADSKSWNVKVIFSVSNPTNGTTWNIKTDLPYTSAGAGLTILFGWDPSSDFNNAGSANAELTSVSTTSLGTGAAIPVQARGLNSPATGATACTTAAECPGVAPLAGRFWVQRSVTPVKFRQAVAKGRIGMEGHPVCNGLPGCPTTIAPFANVPVRSETADFTFVASATPVAAMISDTRRNVVDFDTKCKVCHNGVKLSGTGTPIPRLSLHGNNRNENPKLCVMCHNPNQTDVPYRLVTADPLTSGPETSIDFKRMVHGIHAGGFRQTRLVVIGFNTSINDYSGVRFPAKLSNCLNCHTETGGKGSFELPLNSSVLGSTVSTGSVYALPAGSTRTIDVNPSNDLKITPTAATCSGCHDKAEVRTHMIRTGGASFATLQQNIGTTVVERCVSCHGPGKEEDVRRAHEIRSGSTSRVGSHDDD